MAGKGDKWRKHVDYSKYWENWETIEKKETPNPDVKKKVMKNGKTRFIYK